MKYGAVFVLLCIVGCGGPDSRSNSRSTGQTGSASQARTKSAKQARNRSDDATSSSECNGKSTKKALALQGSVALAEAQPTYEGTIKSMMNSKCVRCHSPTANIAVRVQPFLTSFAFVVQSAQASSQYMAANSPEPMPPAGAIPPLTDADRTAFDAWIAAGTPQGTPAAPIDPVKGVAYADPIQRILEVSCVGCHKPGLTPPDLSTYTAAAAAARVSWVSIQAQSMPPAVPLAADQALAFKKWVDAGAPETLGASTSTRTSTTTNTDTGTGLQTDDEDDEDDADACN